MVEASQFWRTFDYNMKKEIKCLALLPSVCLYTTSKAHFYRKSEVISGKILSFCICFLACSFFFDFISNVLIQIKFNSRHLSINKRGVKKGGQTAGLRTGSSLGKKEENQKYFASKTWTYYSEF